MACRSVDKRKLYIKVAGPRKNEIKKWQKSVIALGPGKGHPMKKATEFSMY